MAGSQAPVPPLNWWSLLWPPWSLGSPHLMETKGSFSHSARPKTWYLSRPHSPLNAPFWAKVFHCCSPCPPASTISSAPVTLMTDSSVLQAPGPSLATSNLPPWTNQHHLPQQLHLP